MRSKFNFCLDHCVSLAISTLMAQRNEKINFGLTMRSVFLKKNQKEKHTLPENKNSIGFWSLTARTYDCLPWCNNLLPISSLFHRPTFLSSAAWVTPSAVMNCVIGNHTIKTHLPKAPKLKIFSALSPQNEKGL